MTAMMNEAVQFGRQSTLIVSNETNEQINLSNLRVVFNIKKSDTGTPNSALITVYNLSQNTVNRIKNEFTRVTLEAGYESNNGLIFDGNIKQVSYGRENSTDNYVAIAGGDGDDAYNNSIVNKVLAAGSKQSDQIDAAAKSMESSGVVLGFVEDSESAELPRGKTMFGMARHYLERSAETLESTWSIQNRNIEVIKKTSVIPAPAIILNSKTGVIGTPQLTNEGITIRTLLNPNIKIGVRVKLNNDEVADARLQGTNAFTPVNDAASKSSDGVYRVLVVNFVGDNFGNDWFSEITCLAVNESNQPGQEVAPS